MPHAVGWSLTSQPVPGFCALCSAPPCCKGGGTSGGPWPWWELPLGWSSAEQKTLGVIPAALGAVNNVEAQISYFATLQDDWLQN